MSRFSQLPTVKVVSIAAVTAVALAGIVVVAIAAHTPPSPVASSSSGWTVYSPPASASADALPADLPTSTPDASLEPTPASTPVPPTPSATPTPQPQPPVIGAMHPSAGATAIAGEPLCGFQVATFTVSGDSSGLTATADDGAGHSALPATLLLGTPTALAAPCLTYSAPGPRTVTVSLRWESTLLGTFTLHVAVDPDMATTSNQPVAAGQVASGGACSVSTFEAGTVADADDGNAADFSVQFDWGDHTPRTHEVVAVTGAGVMILVGACHAYAHTGTYVVTAYVTDAAGGGVAQAHRTVVIG